MTNKILIIDDEEKLRSRLARIIESERFEVIEAKDLKREIDVVLINVGFLDAEF